MPLAPVWAIFVNMEPLSLTHQYFGWKGVFYREYGYFYAEISPAGIPTSGLLIKVPSHLFVCVKEI